MKFAFIRDERDGFSVAAMCRVLKVSRSGYHAFLKRGVSARRRANDALVTKIEASHARSRGAYGSPRVHADLRAAGDVVGRHRVARLMREKGLRARRKRRFKATTDSKHDSPIAPNLLERRFDVSEPNRVWVGDVTALLTRSGWVFLAVLIDLSSRRVVGWAVSRFNDTELALEALEMALRLRRPQKGLIHHTDRGSPYASRDYRETLAVHGIRASMSRKGNCWDNAVAESFFSSLKFEVEDLDHLIDEGHARLVVRSYIEGFYNPERRHSHIAYLNPIEHELRCATRGGCA